MESDNQWILIFTFVTAVATLMTAVIAVWAFFRARKQFQFEILGQSFDNLQRINEKALESDENLRAVIKSANPGDDTAVDEAREIYFHFMRINRIFQAWAFWEGGFISKTVMLTIVEPQVGLLIAAKERLPAMITRGYPKEFGVFLEKQIKEPKIKMPKSMILKDTT